jgi:glycosyltransferase involved in cell wall biosynthesis
MKKKINNSICFVLPYWITLGIGGAELQCYLLAQELVNDGWSVEVLTYKKPVVFNSYRNEKIVYHSIKQSKVMLVSFFRCLMALFSIRSQVIYTRTDARVMRGACALYCRMTGKKLVYAMAHDVEVKKRYYTHEVEMKSGNLKQAARRIDAILTDKLVADSANYAHLILAQTYYQKRELLRFQNLMSVVLRNSFDISSIPIFEKENIILWVGNFRKIKRPELFMKLADDMIDTHYRFVMIGKMYDRENEVKRVKNPRFEALGALSMEDTLEWFQRSKVLVVTSDGEGFSNVFIQAWVYRVQLLSLSVDPDDLLKDKGMGCLFNDDYSLMLKQMREIIDNGVNNQMIEHAYNVANDEFDLKANVRRFKQLVGELEINN